MTRSGDSSHLAFRGAQVGHWHVLGRTRPGKRWLYVVEDVRTRETRRLRGYEVARLARAARIAGETVLMPEQPWSDQ